MSITAIIPAYNEGKYIGGVLTVLVNISAITQIIVVSDGSTDGTVAEAALFGVEAIQLPENIGKGGAMAVGLKRARNGIILFLDADLIGLNQNHVLDLILPVLNNQADMTVGVFENGRLATDMAQHIAPFLSGQRCLRKEWLAQLNDLKDAGFAVETALTQYAYQHNLRVAQVNLAALSHVMKEEKLGLFKGFAYRMKMYWEIAKNARMGG